MDAARISEKLGISRTSFYLYLKDPATRRLSEETKRRIDRAVARSGYRVNVHARSLSSKRSLAVAVLIPLDAPFFRNNLLNECLSGLQVVLFRKGYRLVFVPADGASPTHILRRQLEAAQGYDGCVLFGTRACSLDDMLENVEQLRRVNTRFVVLNMPDLGLDINQVVTITPAASSGTGFLFGQGHRRVLFMGGSKRAPDTAAALEEYKAACRRAGTAVDASLIRNGGYERISAKSELRAAMAEGITFSAVLCLSDMMALGVYEALKEAGRSIPDDVSVVGKDDSFFANILNPALTTVRVPMYEAGKSAAELVLSGIEHDEPPRRLFIETELILRQSTRVFEKAFQEEVAL